MGICSVMSTGRLFIHCLHIELEFRNVGFCGGRKTEDPEEKQLLLEQEREPTTTTFQAIYNYNTESGIHTW